MRRHALLAACAAAIAPLRAQAPEVGTIQVPQHVTITGTLSVDIDGDGMEDLVLACLDAEHKRRELRVHRRRATAPAFANEPSQPPYPLETDVVAFTCADCAPSPGRELVLLTAERAVAVEFRDGAPIYTPLFAHHLVWPAADPDFVLPLPEARCDFDGDGDDDLLLPQVDGALLCRRQPPVPPDGAYAPTVLSLPPWQTLALGAGKGPAVLQGGELRVGLSLGGGDEATDDRGPLVRLRTRAPRSLVIDLDGDGHLDLAAVRNGRLFALVHEKPHALDPRDVALPLPGDRLALFDPAFDVQLAGIDGDRRPDLVLTTSASRDDEVEVRIDVFRTRDDGSWAARPDGRLRLQTLAQSPQLVDADGDGRLDLVAVTVRTDALRALTGGAPTSLEAQLNVYRGTGERFATPALLIQPLALPAKATRGGGAFVHLVAGGNGEPGALLVREGDTLLRRPLQRDGERLRLLAATTKLAVPGTARLRLAGGTHGEVLVLSDQELLHVRMR